MGVHSTAAPGASTSADRWVAIWLTLMAALVVLMVTVGGATRLTDSGLSITEWKPILGAIPPLTQSDWQDAFEKYRQIPEYHLVNKGMSIEAFKFIYWWEWSHRFLGRLIGATMAVPLVLFWLRGAIRPGFGRKLLGVLALGALQGGIGWYMVKSGLVDRVDVSQYRLALHLTVAFLILGALVWLAMDAWGVGAAAAEGGPPAPVQRRVAAVIVALVLLQVVIGAFVAGLKAGLAYNTWPGMDGQLVPDAYLVLDPWYANLFENAATVQFNHRIVAYVILATVAAHAWNLRRMRADGRAQHSAAMLAGAVLVQVALGIATLLNAVPISLGIAHQAMGALVFATAVRHLHVMWAPSGRGAQPEPMRS